MLFCSMNAGAICLSDTLRHRLNASSKLPVFWGMQMPVHFPAGSTVSLAGRPCHCGMKDIEKSSGTSKNRSAMLHSAAPPSAGCNCRTKRDRRQLSHPVGHCSPSRYVGLPDHSGPSHAQRDDRQFVIPSSADTFRRLVPTRDYKYPPHSRRIHGTHLLRSDH